MVDWIPTKTKDGDTLSLLMADYGVALNDILLANGLSPIAKYTDSYVSQRSRELGIAASQYSLATLKKIIQENDINEWVHSIGGECQKFVPGSTTAGRKLAGCPTGGFAVFTRDTEIMLPNKARKGVVSRPAQPNEGAPGAQLPVAVSTHGPSTGAKIFLAVGTIACVGLAVKAFTSKPSHPRRRRRTRYA